MAAAQWLISSFPNSSVARQSSQAVKMISHPNAFLVGPTPQGPKGSPSQIILLTTAEGSLGQLT